MGDIDNRVDWEFHANGRPCYWATIRNGQLDGYRCWWYDNGQLSVAVHYRAGNEGDGYRFAWHPDGRLLRECSFQHGHCDGRYTVVDQTGKVVGAPHFLHGRKVSGKAYRDAASQNLNLPIDWYEAPKAAKGRGQSGLIHAPSTPAASSLCVATLVDDASIPNHRAFIEARRWLLTDPDLKKFTIQGLDCVASLEFIELLYASGSRLVDVTDLRAGTPATANSIVVHLPSRGKARGDVETAAVELARKRHADLDRDDQGNGRMIIRCR